MAGCLLRLLYACPALHACAEAVQLGEGLLRFLAAPQSEGGPLGQGAAASALLAEGGDAEAGSVLALEAADDDAEEEAGRGGGGAAAGRPAVSQVHVAVSAAADLPAEVLLGLARGAADAHAPLTAALAAERLRLATTVLPKEEWQGLAEQVGSRGWWAPLSAPPPLDKLAGARPGGLLCHSRPLTPALPGPAPHPLAARRPAAGAARGCAGRRRAGAPL